MIEGGGSNWPTPQIWKGLRSNHYEIYYEFKNLNLLGVGDNFHPLHVTLHKILNDNKKGGQILESNSLFALRVLDKTMYQAAASN